MDPNQNSNPPAGGQGQSQGSMPGDAGQAMPGGSMPPGPTGQPQQPPAGTPQVGETPPVSTPQEGGLNEVPGAPEPGAGSDSGPEAPSTGSGQAPSDDSSTGGSEGASQPLERDVIAPQPKEGEVWDVAIIGSGPSGLTAAVYTTRAALSTLIIGGARWGGQLMLTTEVDNFPGFPEGIQGPDLMMNMRKQAERFGAEFIQADAESVDFGKVGAFKVVGGGKTYQARSVIIATGAESQWLGLESEQKYIGRGVSSCAPCDAPFFRDKAVLVVGGGDAAMEEALVLTKYASSIAIIHRRDAFRASKAMQQKVLSNPKIRVIWNSEVSEVLGDGSKVTGAKIKNTQDGKEQEIAVEGIFVAIGHTPSTKLLTGQLELDEKGYAKIIQNSKFTIQNESGKEIGNMFGTMSSVEGVFIAGDVHDFHYRQAVTAAGLGCQAAMDAERWLESQKS